MNDEFNNHLPFGGWHRLRYAITREYLNPKHWWWYVRNCWERSRNGVSGYDMCGFDQYMMRVLLQALPHFKNPYDDPDACYGINVMPNDHRCYETPWECDDNNDPELCRELQEKNCKEAQAEWNDYIQSIIDDLEFALREETLEELESRTPQEGLAHMQEQYERQKEAFAKLAPIIGHLWL